MKCPLGTFTCFSLGFEPQAGEAFCETHHTISHIDHDYANRLPIDCRYGDPISLGHNSAGEYTITCTFRNIHRIAFTNSSHIFAPSGAGQRRYYYPGSHGSATIAEPHHRKPPGPA